MDAELKDYLEKRMRSNEELLPEHMRDAMRNYLFHRIEPGSFLAAVLCNDLRGAVGSADRINKQALTEIVQFCMWALPSNAWGSTERVAAWLAAREA